MNERKVRWEDKGESVYLSQQTQVSNVAPTPLVTIEVSPIASEKRALGHVSCYRHMIVSSRTC